MDSGISSRRLVGRGSSVIADQPIKRARMSESLSPASESTIVNELRAKSKDTVVALEAKRAADALREYNELIELLHSRAENSPEMYYNVSRRYSYMPETVARLRADGFALTLDPDGDLSCISWK